MFKKDGNPNIPSTQSEALNKILSAIGKGSKKVIKSVRKATMAIIYTGIGAGAMHIHDHMQDVKKQNRILLELRKESGSRIEPDGNGSYKVIPLPKQKIPPFPWEEKHKGDKRQNA